MEALREFASRHAASEYVIRYPVRLPDGLAFQSVPGDGSCLFHAVGLFLGEDAQTLRANVAAFMRESIEEYRGLYTGPRGNIEAHIEAIKHEKEWGSDLEIDVLQRLFGRPIIIFRPDLPPLVPDLPNYPGTPIYVYYNGHNHYDALMLEEGADTWSILRDIQIRAKTQATAPTAPSQTINTLMHGGEVKDCQFERVEVGGTYTGPRNERHTHIHTGISASELLAALRDSEDASLDTAALEACRDYLVGLYSTYHRVAEHAFFGRKFRTEFRPRYIQLELLLPCKQSPSHLTPELCLKSHEEVRDVVRGEALEFCDLLKPLQHEEVAPNQCLIWGRPGSGKTSLLRYLAYDITQADTPALALYLPLRLLNGFYSKIEKMKTSERTKTESVAAELGITPALLEFMVYCLPRSKRETCPLTPSRLGQVLIQSKISIFILCDGLDEVSGLLAQSTTMMSGVCEVTEGNKQTLIRIELLQSLMGLHTNKMMSITTIFSARPVADVREYWRAHEHGTGYHEDTASSCRILEVNGFSEAAVTEYIDDFCKTRLNSADKATQAEQAEYLRGYLAQESLQALLRTPMTLYMLCALVREGRLPAADAASLTAIYSQFFNRQWAYYREKVSAEYHPVITLNTLHSCARSLALSGLVNDCLVLPAILVRQVFEMLEIAPTDQMRILDILGGKLGLIHFDTSAMDYDDSGIALPTTIEFYHKSAQDFLGAKAITQCYINQYDITKLELDALLSFVSCEGARYIRKEMPVHDFIETYLRRGSAELAWAFVAGQLRQQSQTSDVARTAQAAFWQRLKQDGQGGEQAEYHDVLSSSEALKAWIINIIFSSMPALPDDELLLEGVLHLQEQSRAYSHSLATHKSARDALSDMLTTMQFKAILLDTGSIAKQVLAEQGRVALDERLCAYDYSQHSAVFLRWAKELIIFSCVTLLVELPHVGFLIYSILTDYSPFGSRLTVSHSVSTTFTGMVLLYCGFVWWKIKQQERREEQGYRYKGEQAIQLKQQSLRKTLNDPGMEVAFTEEAAPLGTQIYESIKHRCASSICALGITALVIAVYAVLGMIVPVILALKYPHYMLHSYISSITLLGLGTVLLVYVINYLRSIKKNSKRHAWIRECRVQFYEASSLERYEGTGLFEAVSIAVAGRPRIGPIALRAIAADCVLTTADLRQQVLSYIDAGTNRRAVGPDEYRGYDSIREYYQQCLVRETWGSEIEMQALALKLQRPILLCFNGGSYVIFCKSAMSYKKAWRLQLLYSPIVLYHGEEGFEPRGIFPGDWPHFVARAKESASTTHFDERRVTDMKATLETGLCHNAACCADTLGEHEEAENYFLKGIELAPTSELYAEYAYFLFRRENYADALERVAQSRNANTTGLLVYRKIEAVTLEAPMREFILEQGEIALSSEVLCYYVECFCYIAMERYEMVNATLEAWQNSNDASDDSTERALLILIQRWIGKTVRVKSTSSPCSEISSEEYKSAPITANITDNSFARKGLGLSSSTLAQLALLGDCTLGKAVDDGGCFFDSMAQALNRLQSTNNHSESFLREACADFYFDNKSMTKTLLKTDYANLDAVNDDTYAFVRYTTEQLNTDFPNRSPIWGRPHVEGIMLCHQMSLEKLYVIELLDNPDNLGSLILNYLLVTKKGVCTIDISDGQINDWHMHPCVVVSQQSLHFVPLFIEAPRQDQVMCSTPLTDSPSDESSLPAATPSEIGRHSVILNAANDDSDAVSTTPTP